MATENYILKKRQTEFIIVNGRVEIPNVQIIDGGIEGSTSNVILDCGDQNTNTGEIIDGGF